MRHHLCAALVCLLIASCDGGGGGGGGGANATWVTDTSVYVYASEPKIDTSSPDHIISGTAAQIITNLQAALNDHSSGGVIRIDTGGGPMTITLTTHFDIPYSLALESTPRPIVIDGQGLVTFDGNGVTRILHKGYRIDLTVQGVTFVNGFVPADPSPTSPGQELVDESGAGINSDYAGRLVVIDCHFVDCRSDDTGPDRGGGALRPLGETEAIISDCTFTRCEGSNGGAICSIGSPLKIVNCTFTDNKAFGVGGGLDAGPTGQGGIGGAIYSDNLHAGGGVPRFVLYNCTLTGNTAGDHGGAVFNYTTAGQPNVSIVSRCTFDDNSIDYDPVNTNVGTSGALYTQDADTTIVDSTFSNNDAHDGGGAISMHTGIPSRIANCTFYNNSAYSDPVAHDGSLGGAVDAGGATLYASHCTFADNSAGAGAAIRAGANTWLKNCVFSNNVGQTQWNGHQTWVTCNDGGNNVMWPENRTFWGTTDLPATATVLIADPLLGALADNGGPTQTMALTSGSPCIDIGSTGGATGSDQRGVTRDADPDAGAYED